MSIIMLFLFFIIFYVCLSAMCIINWKTFVLLLNPHSPRWQQDSSRIGTNPGLCLRPMPSDQDQYSEHIFISLQGTQKKHYKPWVEELEEFLDVYKTPSEKVYDCDYDRGPEADQVCNVDVGKWNPCTKENNYNFDKSAPCIFLKLNKIYGWQPEFYNNSQDLPDKMPQNLKEHISNLETSDKKKLNTIWVNCEGKTPEDNKNIGPISYYPERGFQGYFYPYMNTRGYLSPLVAVHFEAPKTGVDISVICKPWAKNVNHDREYRRAYLPFTLKIDK